MSFRMSMEQIRSGLHCTWRTRISMKMQRMQRKWRRDFLQMHCSSTSFVALRSSCHGLELSISWSSRIHKFQNGWTRRRSMWFFMMNSCQQVACQHTTLARLNASCIEYQILQWDSSMLMMTLMWLVRSKRQTSSKEWCLSTHMEDALWTHCTMSHLSGWTWR